MLIRSIVTLIACGIGAFPTLVAAQTLDGATPLQYTPLQTPCRAVDTRVTGGPIAAGTSQSFNPAGGACSIPSQGSGPIAYAMNVTVVPHGTLGHLTVWPTGEPQPVVSTLNSPDGRIKANAAIVTGGNGGEISVYASNTTDLVLDVSGYFTASTTADVYVPITPCRIVDTRVNNGTSFGAPSLVAGQQRTFEIANSSCNLPAAALANGGAVSLNVTTVPIAAHPVSYVTVWGTSETEPQTPLISTTNVPTGTVVANAALVSINPSTSASVSVYATDNTDIILDLTGYFAPASLAPSGLSLYTLPPCRVLDTRLTSGEFQGELTVPFTSGNNCSFPANAQAYVVNATVVPSGFLGFLTVWPDATQQPLASTLNAEDGLVTSNMAIVGTTNGSIDAFATSDTQLILDVSDYFAAASGPTVVVIGDSLVSAWCSPATLQANPTWACQGSPSTTPQETTQEVLARFPAAVALHPQIIAIEAGVWDVAQFAADHSLGVSPCTAPEPNACTNIESMITEALHAGIQVIVCTIPPWGNGPAAEPVTLIHVTDVDAFNSDILKDATSHVIALDMYSLLEDDDGYPNGLGENQDYSYSPQYTTDGVNPNAAGAAVMTQALQRAIVASKTGGALGMNHMTGAAIHSEPVRVNR